MITFISELIMGTQHVLVGETASESHRNRNSRIVQFFLFGMAVDLLLIVTELAAGISPFEDILRHPWLYGYVFPGHRHGIFNFWGYGWFP